jgi:acetyltransferase-like isoleucine patch superfamily enzyme
VDDRLRWALVSRRSPRQTILRVAPDRRPPTDLGRVGPGSAVQPPARVAGGAGIELGDGVTILPGSGLDVRPGARLVIGDHVRVGPELEVICTTGVRIGARSVLGPRVSVADTWSAPTPPPDGPAPLPGAPVEIGEDVRIGPGAIIGPGVRIGDGATVGAGSVVVDDVPAGRRVLGNPAREATG